MLADASTLQKRVSGKQQGTGNLIEIGSVTGQTPTVSELLFQNETFRDSTWEILANSRNRDKDYKTIPPGTRIYIDRTTGELTWSGEQHKQPSLSMQAVASDLHQSGPASPAKSEPVSLGVINSNAPTVSHLLHRNPRFRKRTWDILAQAVNIDKHFHNIQTDTEVLLDPATMEISWQAKANTEATVGQPAPTQTQNQYSMETLEIPDAPVTDLSQAVQPYIGKSYEEINCYELLVNGLKRLHIPYGGSNGLYSKLTGMALDRGMAANAYLNGEGIVEAAGSTVFSKNYAQAADWQKDASELIKELEPLLHNGQILSFSMQTKGHTGIISSRNNRWTFINSGRLDNSLHKSGPSKGVGEEILDEEIRNWFKLAHSSGETLLVTLGELNQEKIRTASNVEGLPDNHI